MLVTTSGRDKSLKHTFLLLWCIYHGNRANIPLLSSEQKLRYKIFIAGCCGLVLLKGSPAGERARSSGCSVGSKRLPLLLAGAC